ncbi:DUF4867 family protein [Bacillaceae bacterium SIJ1]|uniref:DUF4867 family protein n=1 Tax=Litoribacterium kuwaitense TaxID=1398745 RepID=UPI0013EE3B0E|nr:DUF4867 family protein [Litoribacterium kuwaitense]NGP45708.1 DUF4867 family protein [Litoribacterium kuwaitense]
MLRVLQDMNDTPIHAVTSEEFAPFGEVLSDFPVQMCRDWLSSLKIPDQGNLYVASVEEWEEGLGKTMLEDQYFGGMPIQIGYCNGRNETVNGLEYHQGDELMFVERDCVLYVMDRRAWDPEQSIQADQLSFFYLPADTAVRLYSTTMHLSPCTVLSSGYKTLIVLLAGTNTPLSQSHRYSDPFLFQKNKWLVAHEDHDVWINAGVPVGIRGPKLRISYPKEGGE